MAKALGERLPKCDADALGAKQLEPLPAAVQTTLKPLLEQMESLTEKIHVCNWQSSPLQTFLEAKCRHDPGTSGR